MGLGVSGGMGTGACLEMSILNTEAKECERLLTKKKVQNLHKMANLGWN